MRQGYTIQNNKTKFGNQPDSKNLHIGLNRRAIDKFNSFQPILFKNQINNEMFENISNDELQQYLSMMKLVNLDNHVNIYQPDDFIRFLYFPISAVISEFQILENGKTIEVAMTGNEGVVGITSIFKSNSSQNWSEVLIPGKALRIDTELFRDKLDNCKSLIKKLFSYMNSYILQISQRVVCNNYHMVEERLCSWLLMINERCHLNSLPLTQEQMARFLGVHRPSITLITQSLRKKGIIDYMRGKIFIIDKQKLRNLSCLCYSVPASV